MDAASGRASDPSQSVDVSCVQAVQPAAFEFGEGLRSREHVLCDSTRSGHEVCYSVAGVQVDHCLQSGEG
jgi:hypothetical protein